MLLYLYFTFSYSLIHKVRNILYFYEKIIYQVVSKLFFLFIDLEKLSTDFKDLFSSKKSCDVVIKVKDKQFHAHKSVLTARSSVFGLLFWNQHDQKEKEISVISIDDCDPDSFLVFLKYLYTGKAENVTSRIVLQLYCIADKYCVQELKSFCVTSMLKNLTPENVCDIATLAEKFGESQLLSAAMIFINKNIVRIFSAVNWERLLSRNPPLANKLLKEMEEKTGEVTTSIQLTELSSLRRMNLSLIQGD